MFTNVKFELAQNTIDSGNDIIELDIDSLNSVGGGDATSIPLIGGSK
jgi:hypothetical protein